MEPDTKALTVNTLLLESYTNYSALYKIVFAVTSEIGNFIRNQFLHLNGEYRAESSRSKNINFTQPIYIACFLYGQWVTWFS
jgi:hypothetical protein